nr:hypothetical protein CJLB15_00111 [Campylobacter phage CJLB-15]
MTNYLNLILMFILVVGNIDDKLVILISYSLF